MRGVTAALVLIFAACSTAGGDTTTSAPLAEPSTTIATVPSTTTTEPTSTTTPEEACVDRSGDGVLRTRRGFICPPHLVKYTGPRQIHLPGTYTLRSFSPAVRFTRTGQFMSWGESAAWAIFDLDEPDQIPNRLVFSMDDHATAARIATLTPWNQPDGWEWVVDLTVTETQVGGFPATVTTFLGNCPEPGIETVWPRCSFEESAAFDWFGWRVFDGQWTAVVTVDLPSGPFTIVAYDTLGERGYWREAVQPILDSIEFIEP